MPLRYPAPDLIAFATALLERAGLEADKARIVAGILVEGDLLGHTTHGLHLLAAYLTELENGSMTKSGGPSVLADFPAAVTRDGRRLPGPWLVVRAIDLAIARAKQNGTGTVVIRDSHHIACLAAYLNRVTDQGLMVLLLSSCPSEKLVAPHGGCRGVFTPNPIAAAWPAGDEPVMLDLSSSISSLGAILRAREEKRPMAGPWLIDARGHPTDDPSVVFADPRGALLPVGGLDHGHKGFALGLLVEAFTGGLAGRGRADSPTGWLSNVYVQILDPALYGSTEDFIRQMEWLVDACRRTPPRPGVDRVRLPGESGLRRRAEQLANGVELYPGIMPALGPWAQKSGVPLPVANA
ncbi:MAG: lactate dehydrogenase [Verrucomicrobia bacterium RIFCSPLOWO2_12_FULL_64_8]|nr:MAG: lactate dehydrogenase [Verrucomicrobia bacterium RIFCSPLOWO2_12_FULL_64_8]